MAPYFVMLCCGSVWHNATAHGLKFIYPIVVFLLLFSCTKSRQGDSIVIAVKADADVVNPVTHVAAFSRILCTGILPRLLESEFDTATGKILYKPLLARRYFYSENHKSITYILRNDIFWEDGECVTGTDIQFTFRLIYDPATASTKREHLEMLAIENNDIASAVEVPNDTTVIFHFKDAYPLGVFDTNLQPGFLPYHILKNVPVGELRRHSINFQPLSAGPYLLKKWKKSESILLESNVHNPFAGKFQKILFRIIPEYTTRLASLKAGEVDVMYPVYPADAAEIRRIHPELRLERMRGRYYDYLGWQNIDATAWRESGGKMIRPHRFFGSKEIRRALTMAINRQEILDGFLGEFGQVAFAPISPVFRWAYNDTIKPWDYDPVRAKQILQTQGWHDSDGDGILDKDHLKFEFELYYDSGNDRREFAALVVKKNLEAIGIRVNIHSVETNVFYDNELKKNYDAFISGVGVPLQIDPTSEWNSDLTKNSYNDVSYQNATVDDLIERGKRTMNQDSAGYYWKKFQAALHEDEPATFLYWRDEIIAYRTELKNTHTSLLGEIDKFWLWQKE